MIGNIFTADRELSLHSDENMLYGPSMRANEHDRRSSQAAQVSEDLRECISMESTDRVEEVREVKRAACDGCWGLLLNGDFI